MQIHEADQMEASQLLFLLRTGLARETNRMGTCVDDTILHLFWVGGYMFLVVFTVCISAIVYK